MHEIVLDPTWSVHEIMSRRPETLAALDRFGVDTCCGAGVPIHEAARRNGSTRMRCSRRSAVRSSARDRVR